MVCELAEHMPDTPHGGVVLELGGGRGAVWARWSDGNVPEFAEMRDCPATDVQTPRAGCVMFARHPGPCSPRVDPRYKPDTSRLTRVRAALDVLRDRSGARTALQAASSTAALGIWDELTSSGRWASMAACDQAALYRRIANGGTHLSSVPERVAELANALAGLADLAEAPPGTVLAGGIEAAKLDARLRSLPADWQVAVLGDQHERVPTTPSFYNPEPAEPAPRPALDKALAHAEQRVADGEQPPQIDPDWPDWSRDRQVLHDLIKQGVEIARRLGRLPGGWRVDAVRRIQAGTDALRAASVAADMNVMRVHGIYMGSWAGQEPCRLRRRPW
ncbi:hypothetical protein [Streptomyces goshikiensis]|uniref:hypothetical protein n=1 Tax=Streptomyces goshikiensis TaxID=1942 RepID=UPI003681E98B